MTVYVDHIFALESSNPQAKRVGARHGHRWCHMWADSSEELMGMAVRIGLKPEWLQKKKWRVEHFDLTPTKRAQALKAGAEEWYRPRGVSERHPLGISTPSLAEDWNSPEDEIWDDA